ncbi:GspE/PulE family protein [Pantoea ananatis]|uniref:GspE/PulE family protein n=1 Tax=Pantoea ananas TaxID=553 RepID=UPI0021E84A36|nr:ATPase, T2SS/T4P/T4SS family [Pantoea ananatis]MCW0309926.1 hypothetical protein [Pantoea ananatis]MCW0341660.1 hypothetical protein [Pantoea ananatis]MCW0360092.1 hypothetical protein [Pantoea ananatis]MCW0364755.1 hypothetical protein [Pantoea ananatis]MCW1777340.1 ATPase, T2SS/T4P/T4SS family [Pantoea ananatis]
MITDKTHSLVNVKDFIPNIKYSDKIKNSVKLFKEIQSNHYVISALEDIQEDTEYFELRKAIRDKTTSVAVRWFDRVEFERLSNLFSTSEQFEFDTSELQALALKHIGDATARRASDIHIRIENTYSQIFYRIDGYMRQIASPTLELGKALGNTIFNSLCEQHSKSSLSYTEESEARVKEEFVTGFGLTTCRFSSRPGGQGRLLIVMRLVRRRTEQIPFSALGLLPQEESILIRALYGKGGVIFGAPMGEGKSTACQVSAEFCLSQQPGINLVSVEDPVESPIKGAFQTPKGNQSMADAIKSLLRLDVDIYYIGEIRDSESARLVIEAIKTGRLLMTTIHVDSPADILLRLKMLGVDDDLLYDPTVLPVLVGLRLVPKLCEHCKQPWNKQKGKIRQEIADLIDKQIEADKAFSINPGGCEECGFTGVFGRTGIYEVIDTTNGYMYRYVKEGKLAAYLDWIAKGGITLCMNSKRIINEGIADPVWVHQRACNLDRDDKLKAGNTYEQV